MGSTTLPGSLLIGGTGQDYLIGNSGNDTIVGGSPTNPISTVVDEVLVGGAGANVIYGGGGTEFIYADMSPNAVAGWADLDSGDADTIYGGSGTDYIYGSGGTDVIYGGSGTDVIHAGNGAAYIDAGSGNASVYGGSGNDTIIADGASDYVQTGDGNAYVEVTNGNASIIAGAGNDTIDAAGGNAVITGGSGQATLIVGSSSGSDTIQSGSGGTVIQLSDGLTESVLVVRDVNGDLVVSDPGFDTQVTVSGYFNTNTGVSLQFADGTTWGAAQISQASMTPRTDGGNDTLVGSNGNDSITAGFGDTLIVGVSGDNTLTGGAGDDTIQGGSGADTIEGGSGTTQIVGGTGTETYVFNAGDGSDTISENVASGGSDVLQLGAGISASDLGFSYNSASNILSIGFGSTSDATITVANFVSTLANQHQLSKLIFADGSSLSQLQITQLGTAIDGTTGNDYLEGTGGTNYFDGKGGNDYEYGGGGNDTFVFNAGYGQLVIDNTYISGQQPVLQLGAGITATALHITSDGSNLFLTDGVAGDQITLYDMFAADIKGVAALELTDGTILTASQLIQMAMTGTSVNDTLYGTTGADVLDGKGGNDYIYGNGGNDTFVFNAGYGQLEINENYSSGQQPVLQLGGNISASELRVTSNGTNLFLTDGVSGDQITLDDVFYDGNFGVALVTLADGTTLTAAQLIQKETTGTAGSDSMYGTSSAELFDGKGGNDFERGNGGNDTFVFNAGYGDLDIYENYVSGEQPVLQLGAGITTSALRVTSSGTNLVLTDGVDGDQVTLNSMLSGGNYGVTLVTLADGTTLTAAQLIQMETTGTTGNDSLVGTAGANLFDGKGGNDLAQGNGGDDTFVFNAGYGRLEINESYASGQQPVLELGAGITASSLHVTSDGRNVFLTDGVSGDEITFDYMLLGDTTTSYGVAKVDLVDGTSLTSAQLIQMETTGTNGNDTLYGTSGDDLIDGKGGSDSVVGHGGNDTFVFNAGYGDLEINETYVTGQQPVLQLGAGITASALRVSTDATNLFLTDGVSGDQVKLDDVLRGSSANLYGIAMVTLADGTTLTAAQLLQMLTIGTTGNDTLYGTSGADLLDGKGGNDYAIGNGGSDTFVFNSGYGVLEISTYNTSAQPAVLQQGPGITAASLTATTNAYGALILTDGVSGDEIIIDEELFGTGDEGVQEVAFADGSTMAVAPLIQAARQINGTTGNDSLVAPTKSGYVFDGKGGNDTETGSSGTDTFVFDSGYGDLEISETSSSYQSSVLKLGAGITASMLRVTTDGKNVYLTDGVAGDRVTIDNMWLTFAPYVTNAADVDGIGTLQLADGSTLTAVQLAEMEITGGTTGSDTLFGTTGAELIDGKGGNDRIIGNGGADTFVFNAGYGTLEISAPYNSNGEQPVLQLGAGITASDLRVTTNGSDWFLTDGVSGDHITLVQPDSSDGFAVGAVQFADGSTLTAAQLMQTELTGTQGDDTIYGTQGSDLIDGKGGNDSVNGAGGSDTFVFDAGYGHLQINEYIYEGQQPVLQLGEGITASALHVTSDGTNLFLTDGISGDQITLDYVSTNDNYGVSTLQFADGTTLTEAQLIQMATPTTEQSVQSDASNSAAVPQVNSLIHAMASYGGIDPAAITTSPTLNPATSDLLLHAAA